MGVQAEFLDGHHVVVGSAKVLDAADLDIVQPFLAKYSTSTMVFMKEVGGRVLCAVAASDQPREEATKMMHQLKAMHIQAHMLTGDNLGTAMGVGRGIGLVPAQIHAGLTPRDKVDRVQALKQGQTMVGMLGDGVNDGPALSAAHIGLAMGATGSPLALESCDVALMDNNLLKLVQVLKLGRRTKRKIVENVLFSLITKALMIGLAFAGYVSLSVAIAVDVGSMLLVTLNGTLLLGDSQKIKGVEEKQGGSGKTPLGDEKKPCTGKKGQPQCTGKKGLGSTQGHPQSTGKKKGVVGVV